MIKKNCKECSKPFPRYLLTNGVCYKCHKAELERFSRQTGTLKGNYRKVYYGE